MRVTIMLHTCLKMLEHDWVVLCSLYCTWNNVWTYCFYQLIDYVKLFICTVLFKSINLLINLWMSYFHTDFILSNLYQGWQFPSLIKERMTAHFQHCEILVGISEHFDNFLRNFLSLKKSGPIVFNYVYVEPDPDTDID